MNTYYISLVRGLQGCYVKVIADCVETVRLHCKEYYGRLWCSVYSEEEFETIVNKIYKINGVEFPKYYSVINENNPIELNDNYLYE